MDIQSLIATGLTPTQATAYALLIEHGEVKPAEAAQHLKTTRTNAYKILDRLTELKLADKSERGKTLVYTATNPLSLTNLTAEYRAEAMAREEAVNSAMQSLLAKYYEHTDRPGVEVFSGNQAVAEAYRQQINLHQDIYFIRTKADIPMMGFDAMHNIRTTPGRHGNKRYGILTAPTKGPINYASHKRSNLEMTWIAEEQYNAPVEWSVTTSSLLMVSYTNEPHAVLIVDPVIAGAFIQLWQLMESFLRQTQTHKKLSQNRD